MVDSPHLAWCGRGLELWASVGESLEQQTGKGFYEADLCKRAEQLLTGRRARLRGEANIQMLLQQLHHYHSQLRDA